MQISSRFTIAIHMLTCMDVFKDKYKVTSDFLASSIHVNPVIIRKILSQLKNAGLIEVKRGPGGATIAKPLDDKLLRIQAAMEQELKSITLAEMKTDLEKCLGNKN